MADQFVPSTLGGAQSSMGSEVERLVDAIRHIDPTNPIHSGMDKDAFCHYARRAIERATGKIVAPRRGLNVVGGGGGMHTHPPDQNSIDGGKLYGSKPISYDDVVKAHEAAKKMGLDPYNPGKPNHPLNEKNQPELPMPCDINCQCGADSIGGGSHASYCPKGKR